MNAMTSVRSRWAQANALLPAPLPGDSPLWYAFGFNRPDDPATPGVPEHLTLNAYIARLGALSGYLPADDAIKLPALQATWLQLDDLNKSISNLSQDLADAIRDRAEAYTGPAGLKFVFDGVKTSVKAQYGQKSPSYAAVSSMRW